eukprot:TRINITY_DN4190_c0_g2_i1.p1 TRINITY_DN4190_c0_g2~~TRINITY_DN4190_c0_g2_i1.p1  ORF type:complete len:480 (+),score=134.02 TRINITY_DN4190_c0_g2_i1:79-1440(+)
MRSAAVGAVVALLVAGAAAGGRRGAVAGVVAAVLCLAVSRRQRSPRTFLTTITPDFLNAAIQKRHPRVKVRSVDVPSVARCGDGQASTTDRVTLTVGYDCETELPSRMLLKMILLHQGFRAGASETVIRALGAVLDGVSAIPVLRALKPCVYAAMDAYQRVCPHAPDSMYRNEARFYRDIRPELDVETPAVYGVVFEEEANRYGVLMEDLTLRGAVFPNATSDVGVDRLKRLLSCHAQIHARFWRSSRLSPGGDLHWLPTPLRGGMAPVFQAIGFGLVEDQVSRHAFKRKLISPLGKTVREMWELLWRVQRVLSADPVTLCHGDPHIGNTYLLPDGGAGLLDWQLSVAASWAHDVTYTILTGLSTETRRKNEKDLLRFYLSELRANGVQSPPSEEEAWRLYSLAPVWGLVIGWLICPPQNYGEEITSANVSRLAAACADLGSFEAAERLPQAP